jgi:hypothetical protein
MPAIYSRPARTCLELKAALARVLEKRASYSDKVFVVHAFLTDLYVTDLHTLEAIEEKRAGGAGTSRANTLQGRAWLRANFKGAEGSTWTYAQKAAIMIRAAMISGNIADPWVLAPAAACVRRRAGPCRAAAAPHTRCSRPLPLPAPPIFTPPFLAQVVIANRLLGRAACEVDHVLLRRSEVPCNALRLLQILSDPHNCVVATPADSATRKDQRMVVALRPDGSVTHGPNHGRAYPSAELDAVIARVVVGQAWPDADADVWALLDVRKPEGPMSAHLPQSPWRGAKWDPVSRQWRVTAASGAGPGPARTLGVACLRMEEAAFTAAM